MTSSYCVCRHTEVGNLEQTVLTHCQETLEFMHARIRPTSQRQCKWLVSTAPDFPSVSPGNQRPGLAPQVDVVGVVLQQEVCSIIILCPIHCRFRLLFIAALLHLDSKTSSQPEF